MSSSSDTTMDLMLWRHAEAEEASAATAPGPDMKRRLTARGEKQARAVASWLRERQPKHLAILVSPAERCRQTVQALAQRFELAAKLGPGADVADLLSVAGWPEGMNKRGGAVLLVGHQPALGRLAALLLSGQEADWTIKKGGLWWFSNRTRDGETQTVLRAVINPDLL